MSSILKKLEIESSSSSSLPLLILAGASLLVYVKMTTNKRKKKNDEDDENDPNAFLKYQPYEPAATFWSDMKVIKAMWFAKITGTDLQDRLDSFYETQADLYDSYRFRMLHGRPKMLQGVARHVNEAKKKNKDDSTEFVWVDLACGTGANVENFESSIREGKITKVYLVDLCRPLCQVAKRERSEKYGSDIVRVVHGDATDFELEGLPPAGTVDMVTISYSLVMIPDWKKCLQNAKRMLRKGGLIAVADYTVAPDQSEYAKKFWTKTFAKDYVYVNPEHIQTLRMEFDELESGHDYGTFPYTPSFIQSAYYHFVGRNKE